MIRGASKVQQFELQWWSTGPAIPTSIPRLIAFPTGHESVKKIRGFTIPELGLPLGQAKLLRQHGKDREARITGVLEKQLHQLDAGEVIFGERTINGWEPELNPRIFGKVLINFLICGKEKAQAESKNGFTHKYIGWLQVQIKDFLEQPSSGQ